jgi:hypothetical protein
MLRGRRMIEVVVMVVMVISLASFSLRKGL